MQSWKIQTTGHDAWWGFTTATVRQRLKAVIRRGIRSGLSSSNQSPLAEIVEDADDNLFSQVLYNNSHVLNSLLPSTNTRTYNLRQRAHNRTLVAKTSTLTESDFILRMLYKGVYWLLLTFFVIGCGLSTSNKDYDDDDNDDDDARTLLNSILKADFLVGLICLREVSALLHPVSLSLQRENVDLVQPSMTLKTW